MSVIAEIAFERYRQIEEEGFTAAHDDAHTTGQLARAAAAYAYAATLADDVREVDAMTPESLVFVVKRAWPWEWSWWKPRDRRRDLIRAAALLVAEIERLDRTTDKPSA